MKLHSCRPKGPRSRKHAVTSLSLAWLYLVLVRRSLLTGRPYFTFPKRWLECFSYSLETVALKWSWTFQTIISAEVLKIQAFVSLPFRPFRKWNTQSAFWHSVTSQHEACCVIRRRLVCDVAVGALRSSTSSAWLYLFGCFQWQRDKTGTERPNEMLPSATCFYLKAQPLQELTVPLSLFQWMQL